jgi:mono/diheme cytochrome c family protein
MTPRITITLLLGLTLVGCGSQQTPTLAGPTPPSTPAPNPTVTFSSIQHDIFETGDANGRAACTNCHTSVGRSPAGGLDLIHAAAYEQLVNMPARAVSGSMRVVPGDPDRSYLVRTIEGASGIAGQRMPISGPYLTESQIAIVRQWIAQGAPRN